jgi:hypothetical protein
MKGSDSLSTLVASEQEDNARFYISLTKEEIRELRGVLYDHKYENNALGKIYNLLGEYIT